MKNSNRVRPKDERGLRAFLSDYPEARATAMVSRGRLVAGTAGICIRELMCQLLDPIPRDRTDLTRRNTPIIVLVSVVILLFAAMSALTDFPLLDTMWRASANKIHRAVTVLTVAQIRAYRIMLAVDFGYAAAYTSLLVLLFRLSESRHGFRGLVTTTKWVAVATAVVLLAVRLCCRNYRAPTPQP